MSEKVNGPRERVEVKPGRRPRGWILGRVREEDRGRGGPSGESDCVTGLPDVRQRT